jgi:plastocyanin
VNSLPVALSEPQFVVVGGCFALWAVVLAFSGLSRHNFPMNLPTERLVMGISALLMVGAIGTAIGFAKNGPKGSQVGKEKQAAANKTPPPKGPVQSLALSADPTGQLKFDKPSLQAKAGGVKIVMTNPAPVQHSIAIQGNGVNVAGPVVGHGAQSTAAATLKSGTYTFFCTVPGHRQAGMQGTLTVK